VNHYALSELRLLLFLFNFKTESKSAPIRTILSVLTFLDRKNGFFRACKQCKQFLTCFTYNTIIGKS